MHWSEVWHGTSPRARLARTALTPLAWLYAAGWQTYLAVYRLALKKPKEPHKPVICIGNLVAGGSGKSPATLYVASLLTDLGRQVVIGCSGYGSPRSKGASVAAEGPLDAQEWGDEPAMFRWLCPELPLIVGRNRVRAAEVCHERFAKAVLLMDDGFQHLPVRKHLSLVLDPPTNNRRCMPAGPYREPRKNRSRADLVLPGHFQLLFNNTGLTEGDGTPVKLSTGARVNVLCALGNPSRFLADVKALDLHADDVKLLQDHDDLQMGNLFESFNPDLPVLVTAKDWVKLQRRSDLGTRQILIARQEARIEPEAEFKDWLARKLNELSIQ